MTAYSPLPTVNTGDPWTAAAHNTYVRDNFAHFAELEAALEARPQVRVKKSANQSIGAAATAALTWDQESYDTHGSHDNVTNNMRLTAPYDGYYLVLANVMWDGDLTGSRQAHIQATKGGTPEWIASGRETSPLGNMRHSIGAMVYLAEGDYVEIYAYNADTTAPRSVVASVTIGGVVYYTNAEMVRLF